MINGNIKLFNSCEETLIKSLMDGGLKKSRVGVIKDLIIIRNSRELMEELPEGEGEVSAMKNDITEMIKHYAISALEKLKKMSDEEYMSYEFAG